VIVANEVKETGIGLMPNEWGVVNLSDECVAELIMGQSPASSTYNQDRAGLPFMQGKAEFGRIYPDPDKWCSSPSRVAEQNDILMSVRAPVGDVNIAPFKCAIGRGLAAIRAKQKSTPLYLFFYLQFAKKRLEDEGTGSIFKAINKGVLENFKIALPKIGEQKNIIVILSCLQHAIDQQEQIIDKTKELKRSLMHRLFTYGLRGEELKETEIGRIPKGWKLTSIGQAYEFTTKPRGLDISKHKEIPFIPMEIISENQRLLNKYEMRKSFSSGTYVQKGDLVVAKITPSFENGKQGIVTDIPLDFCYATTEVWPLHGVDGQSNNIEYLHYYLKKPDVRNEIAGKMEGSTGRQRVPKNVLFDTKIPLPSCEEQVEISDIFISLDSKMDATEAKKKSIQGIFKSMLQLLMTGQVRVKDVDFGEINV